MSKEQVRQRAAKQRNELLDQLYALPELLRKSKVLPLGLHWIRSQEKISSYIQGSLLDETAGIEIYEVPSHASIGLIPVSQAVQGVLNAIKRSAEGEHWSELEKQLHGPVQEVLRSLQMLDAMWPVLPESISFPVIQMWQEEDETSMCIRINHPDGSWLGSSTPLNEACDSFVSAEAPRHPGSWFHPRSADLSDELLHG